jgi:Tfp pilus assembly protein PilP
LNLIHLLTLAYLILMVGNQALSIQEQKNLGRQIRQEIKALTVKLDKFQVQAPQVKQPSPHQSNEGIGSDAEDELLKLGPITYWGSIQGGKSPKALIEIEDQSSLYRLGQSIGHHYFIKHFDQEQLILESKKGHQKVVMMEPAQ